MKRIKSKLRVLALAAGSLAITALSANAANSFYAPGDLVLFFQQEGGTNTVYANLGNAATLYRGAATGVDVASNFNFLDINATLVSAFGAGWATDTTLYAGLAAVWGTSSSSTTLQNGDPHRTLYVSSARNSVGTLGSANSTGWDLGLAGDTAMSNGATGIATQNNVFENNYNVAQTVSPTSTSGIDNANPFSSPGIQGPAFNAFSGGVQQVGSASTIGAFGGAGTAEFALDLFRIQAKNNIAGQVGNGETLRLGTYEGSVTVNTNGQVSFVTSAVPEPSTYALMGVSALVIGFVVRRRRAQNL